MTDNPKTDIFLIKALWCGHCKNFEPIFNNTSGFLKKDKLLKKNKINMKSFDFADEKIKKNFEDEYGKVAQYIDGYPTVFLRHESKNNVKYTTIETAHEDGAIKKDDERLNNATEKFVKNIKESYDSLSTQKGGGYDCMLEKSLEKQLSDIYYKKKYENYKNKYLKLKEELNM